MSIRLPFVAPVRGVSFHADNVATVVVGHSIEVRHEPDNPYDANACAVYVRGKAVGHLARPIAERLVASGASCWKGVVAEVLAGERATGLRVRIVEAVGNPTKQTKLVRARSGRELGTLVCCDEDTVTVLTPSGHSVSYPCSLVEIP